MDSAVSLAIAIDSGFTPAALHLNYGQRTEKRELKAFDDLCNFYNIGHKLVVDIHYLAQIGASSLTDTHIKVENADLNRKDIPSTYVPFRNGNILAIAASWAEVLRANAIFTGATQADSSGYPDCRKEFFDAYQEAINLGTKPDTNISIISPLINLTKADIVTKGFDLNVPFTLTWSCYQSNNTPCGVCDSCFLRKRGFDTAGKNDPLLNY